MNTTHPDILRAERTGYIEERDVPRCPRCGETLYYDDQIYFTALGREIVGCSNCIFSEDTDEFFR